MACRFAWRFWRGRWGEQGEDRKSTRLNSSHSQISYAVFCLKKKNVQLPKSDRHVLTQVPTPLLPDPQHFFRLRTSGDIYHGSHKLPFPSMIRYGLVHYIMFL